MHKYIYIALIIIILSSIIGFLFMSAKNPTSSLDGQQTNNFPIATPIVSNTENSLNEYFKMKSGTSTNTGSNKSNSKEINCEINGQIVKEGTVISGETCVTNSNFND